MRSACSTPSEIASRTRSPEIPPVADAASGSGTVGFTRASSWRTSWNYPDYLAFRDRVKGFAGLAAGSGVGSLGLQLPENGQTGVAELVQNQFVSGNYFDVLGLLPAAGHLFSSGDEVTPSGHPVVVLSHGFWVRRFGADPAVIGGPAVGRVGIGVRPTGGTGQGAFAR